MFRLLKRLFGRKCFTAALPLAVLAVTACSRPALGCPKPVPAAAVFAAPQLMTATYAVPQVSYQMMTATYATMPTLLAAAPCVGRVGFREARHQRIADRVHARHAGRAAARGTCGTTAFMPVSMMTSAPQATFSAPAPAPRGGSEALAYSPDGPAQAAAGGVQAAGGGAPPQPGPSPDIFTPEAGRR